MQNNRFIHLINNQLYKSKYLTIFKRLGSHSVLALIALIVIGGATRVMEAGLACPDWPLCYGSFLPFSHMNLRVFLEWFHRLDAFLVGILIFFKSHPLFFLRFHCRIKLQKSRRLNLLF